MIIHMTSPEKTLKIALRILAFIYLVTCIATAMPMRTVEFMNRISRLLSPSIHQLPASPERFWSALTMVAMFTLFLLALAAQHNVRKQRGIIIVILLTELSSAVTGIILLLQEGLYLAYLFLPAAGLTVFIVYLVLFLRANRAFFEEQTAYLRKAPENPKITPPTKVAALKGDDKFKDEDRFKLLDRDLDETGYFDKLERRYMESGKKKEDYSVVIKPNFMYLHHKKDISTYTDPKLVEHLVDRIAEKGFSRITLVEARSTYGNYFRNREVVTVALYAGYSQDKNYRIVDLTEEMVPFDYGGRLGRHFVGPAWRDADFRISFAKNKTHVFSNYTLTLKNIYGTLPMENKLKEYHSKREYDWPTIESMKHFPVHFGLIDAIYSADGQFGVIVDPTPNHTKTIIGGENLIAVDWVGAKKMGLDPDNPHIGRFLSLAVEAFGRPERIDWAGDTSVYSPWTNVSNIFIQPLDIIEEAYHFSNWWFECLIAMDSFFPLKKTSIGIYIMRKLLAPFKRLLYRYDKLT